MKHKKRKTNVIYSDGILSTRSKNEYQRLVRNANAKRSRLIEKYYNEIKNTPNMTGISKDAFIKQLERKGFITEKFSSSLKGFKSLEEVKLQIRDLKQINEPYYNQRKIGVLRSRMLRQIYFNTGNKGSEVAKMIKNLSNAQLINLYNNASEDFLEEIFDSDSVGNTPEDKTSALIGRINVVGRNILTKEQQEELDEGKENKSYKGVVDFFSTKHIVKVPKEKKEKKKGKKKKNKK